jgi:hypothetical protein
MIEAGNFSHAFQSIKVLERRYNTHDQAAKSALTLAFHSLKQETGESGAEFVDCINAAAMKLEKTGEVVSDAAKLTRLIHPNQGSGSMYDKLGMTIYTTPPTSLSTKLLDYLREWNILGWLLFRLLSMSTLSSVIIVGKLVTTRPKSAERKSATKTKKRKTSSGSSEYSSEDFSGKRRSFPCCICDAKDLK